MKKNDPLADCVKHAMQQYLNDLNGQQPQNLHNFFMQEVEKPFLEVVMTYTDGNQSKASNILGINRNTLRKKLVSHGINWP